VAEPVGGGSVNTLLAVSDLDLVWVRRASNTAGTSDTGQLCIAHRLEAARRWELEPLDTDAAPDADDLPLVLVRDPAQVTTALDVVAALFGPAPLTMLVPTVDDVRAGITAADKLPAGATIRHLIAHAEQMRYRVALLDSGDNQSIAEVRALRAGLDSRHAALYYPWVTVLDPVGQGKLNLPPSGFVAGICARVDTERGVHKAPANQVVRLAIGFETLLDNAQQAVLNPEGINAFRSFEGRGLRLWGARTISSDPDWRYLNVRRYVAYLERSIEKGTQWGVFEPNGDALWARVRRTIEDFLLDEWRGGALQGNKA
jgi:phage tail sheath protein FI